MAQVFSGKVAILGDQLENYFQALADAEKARQPFREYLESLNNEFEAYLAEAYTKKTARKHSSVVDLFIHFLCGYTDVESLEEVTKGMANSQFRQWYHRKVISSAKDNDLKVAIRKFFQFLETEKGIKNEKALSGLK